MLPSKSHDTPKLERPPPKQRVSPSPKLSKDCYKSISEVFNNAKSLKSLSNWTIEKLDESVELKFFDGSGLILPLYHLYISHILEFIIYVYGWRLPHEHDCYIQLGRSLKSVTVSADLS